MEFVLYSVSCAPKEKKSNCLYPVTRRSVRWQARERIHGNFPPKYSLETPSWLKRWAIGHSPSPEKMLNTMLLRSKKLLLQHNSLGGRVCACKHCFVIGSERKLRNRPQAREINFEVARPAGGTLTHSIADDIKRFIAKVSPTRNSATRARTSRPCCIPMDVRHHPSHKFFLGEGFSNPRLYDFEEIAEARLNQVEVQLHTPSREGGRTKHARCFLQPRKCPVFRRPGSSPT
mmetsp:Transcript_25823/g.67683  ORF Transcript_25823/g.67683 Transcript_25823/m.67683 type:complete len:232 (+) Transcript_25823:112-807(+)